MLAMYTQVPGEAKYEKRREFYPKNNILGPKALHANLETPESANLHPVFMDL